MIDDRSRTDSRVDEGPRDPKKPVFFEKPCFCLLVVFLVLGVSQSASAADASARILRAGAAVADITPPLGENIVGSFSPHPATGVHDLLHARCLILDNGETQIALVICDNLGIPRDIYDDARKKIAASSKFPVDHILMAATHTHSGTRAHTETFRPILVQGIADAVLKAIDNLAPARIGWSGVDEPSEVFNRRWHVTDPELRHNPFGGVDTVRMNPPRGNAALVKPAGPIDPEVSFISVQSTDGRPLALLANYSLHYVGGTQRGEISADYFAIFADRIGKLMNVDSNDPPFVGIMSNGTSGDINNINFRKKSDRRERYEKMTEVAELIAQRVHATLGDIEYHDWVPLGSAREELTLTVRKPDEQMQRYFKERLALPDDAPKHHRYERVYAQRVQKLLDGPDEITVPLQVVRIGELSIAAIPFETFVEIGLEIKEKSPFADTFTIELANDYHGYLPTPEQHKLGGYETWMGTNRVQFDASARITKVVLKLMQRLHEE